MDSPDHIAHVNPFRYRGYYYDAETGFYWLQSRYYDPEVGRFVNEDGYVSTGQGILGNNMFAYCLNNPVNNHDPSGKFALTATICGIAVWKIGLALIGTVAAGAITYVAMDTLVKNPPAMPSLSLPKVDVKPKADSKEKEKDIAIPSQPKKQAYFTTNPYDFAPKGLVVKEYPGTKNGRIIEWRDPISQAKIFEWNEDLKNGSHYHAMMIEWDGKHHGTHYLPNTPVPEPWNSIYFGG